MVRNIWKTGEFSKKSEISESGKNAEKFTYPLTLTDFLALYDVSQLEGTF